MIKEDEILVVKTILEHCKKDHDLIPTDTLLELPMNGKRLLYLMNKFWFIEYGVNVMFGWLECSPWEIKEYYKNVHGVEL
jgi:hypothetical protein